MMKEEALFFFKAATANRAQFEASDLVGCFCCCKTFKAPFVIEPDLETAINEGRFGVTTEADGGQTIVCVCGVDSVIGSASGIAITPEFLKAMHGYWFKLSES